MTDERWRLFVAAPLTVEAAAALWKSLAPLRARHPEARWMPTEHYHATLAFVGSTDPRRVPDITAAVGRVAGSSRRFAVETGDASGRAGGRRGGVAWLRLATGWRELDELALAVDREIGSGLYGMGAPPRPHVTVARRVDDALLADLRLAAREFRIPWPVERIVLFRSHTGPTGSRYEELSSAELVAAAQRG